MLPVVAHGAETVYKSVDEAGHVTYSSRPRESAAEVERVQLPPGPTNEAAEKAQDRANAVEQAVDSQYQEVMERRRKKAQAEQEAQEAAERERVARETAERQQRIEEALDQLETEGPYVALSSVLGLALPTGPLLLSPLSSEDNALSWSSP